VKWTYKNYRGQVYLQISVNGGKKYFNICNSAFPGTDSSYDWQIPLGADTLVSQNAVIMVKEYPPFAVNGVSNKFSIIAR